MRVAGGVKATVLTGVTDSSYGGNRQFFQSKPTVLTGGVLTRMFTGL